ncbi:hypothetical protein F511_06537 [Dorcoceras hygrometricum]|uniref:Uncharacterized protein n=1 Tax=Dorcoceras hygrometricum TaxID=472368 RepID=A0A2Z7CE13_9LAMI|nr:hypothetical protein F511_06537 [Dorcoceras hygrometricum]
MKRRRAGESADGLALMTSSVTSSYSADGLREQSQESADSADALCVDQPVASFIDPDATQRFPDANLLLLKKIQTKQLINQLDNQTQAQLIQSRASLNQLLLCIQSQAEASSRKISSRKISNRSI